MTADDQSAAIDFLAAPAAYGPGVTEVERIDTHISVVFLAGPRAYKLKRAVRFDYVDFSTVEKRRIACEAEVALNRRTAPSLYRGVVAVTRGAGGALALGGDGEPVDWVVEMTRFDQDRLFSRLAERGALDDALIAAVADAVARLHAAAERRTDRGGRDAMARVVAGNVADLAEVAGGDIAADAVEDYRRAAEDALARLGDMLDARRAEGFVRHGHGDLHLRNICLLDGRPTLFDAVEFNDDIACGDVLYDVAFLVMDLLHRGLARLANVAFNRYLARTEDVAGLRLFGFFLSCRAAVRAKTSMRAAAAQGDAGAARDLRREAAGYLDEARRFLEPQAPRLIAVGGLSGSGKSTLAAALAPSIGAPPGALVLRSDVVRKRIFGLDPETPLGAEAYAEPITREVYERIAANAETALRAGRSVVADAVYARPAERAAIAGAAAGAGVLFTGLWLEAPAEVLEERVGGRTGDASDADAAVLSFQLGLDVGAVEWRRIDASESPDAVRRRAESALSGAAA